MSAMSEIEAVSGSRAAADYFITAANYIAEDAGIRRLRYNLLRLGASAVSLTRTSRNSASSAACSSGRAERPIRQPRS